MGCGLQKFGFEMEKSGFAYRLFGFRSFSLCFLCSPGSSSPPQGLVSPWCSDCTLIGFGIGLFGNCTVYWAAPKGCFGHITHLFCLVEGSAMSLGARWAGTRLIDTPCLDCTVHSET